MTLLLGLGGAFLDGAAHLAQAGAHFGGGHPNHARRICRQRLPVRDADDEIYTMARGNHTMLDKIATVTSRGMRTVLDSAAHDLRTPTSTACNPQRRAMTRCAWVTPEGGLLERVTTEVEICADTLDAAAAHCACRDRHGGARAGDLSELVREVVDCMRRSARSAASELRKLRGGGAR